MEGAGGRLRLDQGLGLDEEGKGEEAGGVWGGQETVPGGQHLGLLLERDDVRARAGGKEGGIRVEVGMG
jgi:hypothetical protein